VKDLHRLLLKVVNDHTRPSHLLARGIAEKMEEQGVEDALQYLDKIEAQVQALLDNPSVPGLRSLQIHTSADEADARNIKLTLDESDISRWISRASKAIEQAIPEAAEDVARWLLRRIKRGAREGLAARASERSAFEFRLWDRWASGLELLSLEVALATEAGELANKWLRKHLRRSDSFVVDVLTRLHARACQVAGEVEALLSSGHADGAAARWRTLHELSVVSWFIQDKGNEVAEQYLLHTTIDSLRAARQYNELAPIVGYKPFSQRELATLERQTSRLVKRFGSSFREEYGWASAALGNPAPRFADIEKSVDLRALRPWYKLASHNVHAGPKGALFRLGLLQTDKPILLAGPSNVGLDEAGCLTAISLCQISICLLLHRTTFDSLVWSKILVEVSREAEDAFTRTAKQLEREERALAKAARAKKPTRSRARSDSRGRN
jgi:hypothetical protein